MISSSRHSVIHFRASKNAAPRIPHSQMEMREPLSLSSTFVKTFLLHIPSRLTCVFVALFSLLFRGQLTARKRRASERRGGDQESFNEIIKQNCEGFLKSFFSALRRQFISPTRSRRMCVGRLRIFPCKLLIFKAAVEFKLSAKSSHVDLICMQICLAHRLRVERRARRVSLKIKS